MKKLMAVAVCAAGLAGYAADDHLVDVGASETLAANTEYGRLVVNGDLTVGADVELKVASLCVATNITGTANLVLEAGAKLTVTGTSKNDCLIGAAGGHAVVELKKNSLLSSTAALLGLGYVETPDATASATKAEMMIGDGAVFATTAEGGLNLCASSQWPKNVKANVSCVDIRIDEGGQVNLQSMSVWPQRLTRMIFNGGALKATSSPWKKPFVTISRPGDNFETFAMVSTNGCPIDISMLANHNSLLSGASESSSITFSGDGDLIISGVLGGTSNTTKERPLILKGLFHWDHLGKVIVRDPIMILNGKERFGQSTYYMPHEFVIDRDGGLDLKGNSLPTKKLTIVGMGVLTNSSETVATLTIGHGDVDCELARSLPPRVTLQKVGKGRLTAAEDLMPSLAIAEGGLTLVNRSEYGYPFYKFNVYGTGNTGTSNARVRIAELVYLNGDEDVTQGWQALYYTCSGTSYYNSPTEALDGDLATFFYDQRAQSYSSVSNIHFELEYPLPRKVTGYKWTYHTGIDNYNSNPTSWEVFGSDDNRNWVSLDYVEYQKAGWTGWTTRTCTIPTAGDYAVTMAAGTALKVVGADVSGKVTTASDTLALEKGAKVELTAGTKVAELTIDADDATDSTVVNFDFAETGVLNVIGSARRLPAALPLALPDAADAVLSGWTVTYNGEPAHYLPVVKNGRLTRQSTQGLLILVR